MMTVILFSLFAELRRQACPWLVSVNVKKAPDNIRFSEDLRGTGEPSLQNWWWKRLMGKELGVQ
jgi:hypothetical protein